MSVALGLSRGLVSVSIDLDGSPGQEGLWNETASQRVVEKLRTMLSRYRIGATWVIGAPAQWNAATALCSSESRHELALLIDADSLAVRAPRRQLSRELTRRLLAVRALGLTVDAAVFSQSLPSDHLDLMVKHGINAIRGPVRHRTRIGATPLPRMLRYGLWELPGSIALVAGHHWLFGARGRLTARRAIRCVAIDGGYLHFVIDAAQLLNGDPSAMETIEQTLLCIDRFRDQQQLETATLSQVANHLTCRRSGTPARSILRPAG